MTGWLCSCVAIWLFPSACGLYNPFLAQVATYIQSRSLQKAFWAAYLSGLVLDALLSSHRFGLLGLASLVSAATIYRVADVVNVESKETITALLAAVEYGAYSTVSWYAGTSWPFQAMWSWKGLVLFVVLSTTWTFCLNLSVRVMQRIVRRRRRA